jgi:ubiquitin carboxyl-terminal hydrolase 9/24
VFSDEKTSSSYSLTHEHSTTINYELIGIVIHSGQANAGHYYSLIRDTRSATDNRWYRFNDISVDEMEFDEQTLEDECFGGKYYVVNDKDKTNEERIRSWNAYMLIYRCIEPKKLLRASTNHQQPLSTRQHRRVHINQDDSLPQLSNFVIQNDENNVLPMTTTASPSRVLACVEDENLQFIKHRDTYCTDYYEFMLKLSSSCLENTSIDRSGNDQCQVYEVCTQLTLHFLFYTHLRTHRRLRQDTLSTWLDLLSRLLTAHESSCSIFYRFILNNNAQHLKVYLVECPIDDIRQACSQCCEYVLQASYVHLSNRSAHRLMTNFIEQFVCFLDKLIIEHVKHSQAYFRLMHAYLLMSESSVQLALSLNVHKRLMNFLFDTNIDDRRWTTGQAEHFGIVHEILSILAHTALTKTTHANRQTSTLINEIEQYYCGHTSVRYLRELIQACHGIVSIQLSHTLKLLKRLTTDRLTFSDHFLTIILQAVRQTNANESKSLFKLLGHILVKYIERIDTFLYIVSNEL